MDVLQGIIIYLVVAYTYFGFLNSKLSKKDRGLAHGLIYYHLLFTIVYYIYALFNISDSTQYFNTSRRFLGNWMDLFNTGTEFIRFLAYPFTNTMHLSYEFVMFLFGAFGYAGFLYMLIFFRENIKGEIKWQNLNMITIIFLLPNLHFWSASLGKGSVIFTGIAMVFFALNKIKNRIFILLAGFFFVYYVRPHIALMIIMAIAIGSAFTNKGISKGYKFLILLFSIGAFALVYNDVMKYVGVDNVDTEARLDRLASDLGHAGSGVDISNYNIAEKLFTLLYRPLFVDSPNSLGLFSSCENVVYIIITILFLKNKGLQFVFKADAITKTAFIAFLTASLALAQITGNLGIAMRQKSQVMILFMFVVVKLLYEEKKAKEYNLIRRQKAISMLNPASANALT